MLAISHEQRIADLRAIQSTRPLTKSEAGTLGGLETLRRHGVKHLKTAGAKGFQAYCKKNNLCAEQALFRLAKGGRLKVDFNARWKQSPVYKALKAGASKICICTNHVTAGNDCWTCGGYVL